MILDTYDTHGNLNMPGSYVVDWVWLPKWLYIQRNIYQGKISGKQLTWDQIKAADKRRLLVPARQETVHNL